jgi:RNA polymerase sigma factor (sigma-70 family)
MNSASVEDSRLSESQLMNGTSPSEIRARELRCDRATSLHSVPCAGSTGVADDGVSAFINVRPRLFGVAYRMLGNVAEAEDTVQDAWLRWQTTDRSVVRDAPAFLITITTRLAINRAKSGYSRRETYVGTWLPEPVDTSADPGLGAERGEALQLAVLLLLEKLSPSERAAYVLREAFNYEYSQIGEIIRVSEENGRQLVARARKHIADGRRTPVGAQEQRRLLEAFIGAAQKGDVAALEGLFASDVVSYSDGGGFVRAARRPVMGRARVAKFIGAIAAHHWNGVTLAWIEVNGQASVLISCGGIGVGLVTVTASEEGIVQLMWMMRPSKLTAVARA